MADINDGGAVPKDQEIDGELFRLEANTQYGKATVVLITDSPHAALVALRDLGKPETLMNIASVYVGYEEDGDGDA